MIASGVIAAPVDDGDSLEGCPEIVSLPGTAAAPIDEGRDEA